MTTSGWLDKAFLGLREANELPTLAPTFKARPGFFKTF